MNAKLNRNYYLSILFLIGILILFTLNLIFLSKRPSISLKFELKSLIFAFIKKFQKKGRQSRTSNHK
jgi:hypothetical protein